MERDFQQELLLYTKGIRGELHIGSTYRGSFNRIPPLLNRMKDQFPQVQCFLHDETFSRLERLLEDGTVDVIYTNYPLPPNRFYVETVGEDHLLAVLPDALPSPFAGLLIAVVVYAIGGGLLEVLVSPVMESCPTDNKAKAMSLLHSFYCWGHVGVVLISTAFFTVCGIENWKILAALWALIPLCNFFLFLRVPIAPLVAEGERGMRLPELFRQKTFWLLFLMMMSAGASEQAVSQWASTFAEQGLGVSKTVGDLAGPMAFAVCMGLSRAFYGRRGDRIDLDRFMAGSGLLCVAAYLVISLVPVPALGLVGCAVCEAECPLHAIRMEARG